MFFCGNKNTTELTLQKITQKAKIFYTNLTVTNQTFVQMIYQVE